MLIIGFCSFRPLLVMYYSVFVGTSLKGRLRTIQIKENNYLDFAKIMSPASLGRDLWMIFFSELSWVFWQNGCHKHFLWCGCMQKIDPLNMGISLFSHPADSEIGATPCTIMFGASLQKMEIICCGISIYSVC